MSAKASRAVTVRPARAAATTSRFTRARIIVDPPRTGRDARSGCGGLSRRFRNQDLDPKGELAAFSRPERPHADHATGHHLATLVVDLDEDGVLPGRLRAGMADGAVYRQRADSGSGRASDRHRVEAQVALTRRTGHGATENPLAAVWAVPGLASHRQP